MFVLFNRQRPLGHDLDAVRPLLPQRHIQAGVKHPQLHFLHRQRIIAARNKVAYNLWLHGKVSAELEYGQRRDTSLFDYVLSKLENYV